MFNLKFILIKVKKKERENINLFLIIYLNLIFSFLKKLTNYKSFSLPITLSTIRCKKKECKTSQYSGETMKKKKSNGKPSLERQVQEPMTIKLWILSFEQGWLPSCFHLFLRTKQKIKPTRALRLLHVPGHAKKYLCIRSNIDP